MPDSLTYATQLTKTSMEVIDTFSVLLQKSLEISSETANKIIHEWLRHCDEKKLNDALVGMLDTTGSAKNLDNVYLTVTGVNKEAAPTFSAIYQREFLRPALILDMSAEDSVIDGLGDVSVSPMEVGRGVDFSSFKNPVFLSLSSEHEKLELIRAETHARMGLASEIPMGYVRNFADKLKDNPLLSLNGLTPAQYEALRLEVAKLPKDMHFSLFPDYMRDEKGNVTEINVGFLSRTGGIGAETSYSIPDIMKSIMVKTTVLENDKAFEPYLKKLEYDIRRRNTIVKEAIEKNTGKKEEIIREVRKLSVKPSVRNALAKYVEMEYEKEGIGEMRRKFAAVFEKLDLEPVTVNRLLKKLEEADKTMYVVKAEISIDDKGEKHYHINTQDYAVTGKTLEIYEHGREMREYGNSDEDIKDPKKAQAHKASELDGFMKNTETTPNTVFLMLTEQEFKKSKQKAQNMLKRDEIAYLKGQEAVYLSEKVISTMERADELTLNAIEKNKGDFVLLSPSLDAADGKTGYNEIDQTEMFADMEYKTETERDSFLNAALEADATSFEIASDRDYINREIEKARAELEREKAEKEKTPEKETEFER